MRKSCGRSKCLACQGTWTTPCRLKTQIAARKRTRRALAASDWRQREAALVPAFETMARAFDDLGLTDALEPTVRQFYSRPFLVLGSARFAEACMARTPLARLGWAGGIDQFVDSVDVLSYPAVARRLRGFVAGRDG